MHDREGESMQRLRSRASMSRLETTEQVVLEPRSASRATTRRTEKTASNFAATRSRTGEAGRGRLTAKEFANNLQRYKRRYRSLSSQGSQKPQGHADPRAQRPKRRISTTTALEDAYSVASDNEDEFTGGSVVIQQMQPAYVLAQGEKLYKPSRTQLFRDANTFQNYRIRSVARDLVDKWCYAAVQAKDHHEHMERLASARDIEILLLQAFEHWRHRLHAKRQVARWKHFWEDVSGKITAARNAFLLRRTFNKWRDYAYHHALFDSKAREHILSVKYFQAWRNITVGNQLKTVHQGQRKFFGIWKQRYIRSLTHNIKADLVRQASLSRNLYWDWFWAFCGRRAPDWRNQRLKRKYFLKLIDSFRSNIGRDQQISMQWENTARKKALLQWLVKARLVISAHREAAMFSHQKLIARAMPAWRQDARYSPLARQVSNLVDWRVARATFTIFLSKFQFEKQAEHVNRLRIIRNQWTCWNDRLRSQSLSHHIDERCLREAVFKWIDACRANIIYRLLDQKLQKKCLYKLKTTCLGRQRRREAGCQGLQTTRDMKCLRAFFGHWRIPLGSHRQAEQIAFEFHAPKIAQDILRTWVQYFAYQRNLDNSARTADFYFVGRKLLKRWHTASIESKRQKRRNAYVQVRRGIKMRLAAGILQHWRQSSAQIRDMRQEADVVDQIQLLRFGTSLFDNWKSQFDLRRDQAYQAKQHYDRRLVERCLYTWIERLEDQARMEETAELNDEMHVRTIALGWLHKLRLRIIEQNGREAKAENLRNWYERRHFHNMLRHWQDKSAKARSQPHATPALSSKVSRARTAFERDDREGPTRRAEDWTDFDIGDWMPTLEAQSNSTPLPGYLSTPSKRAARAKALVKASTTPAGTPFEHRLRSQLGSTPRTSRGGRFGRSIGDLRGSTFGAILEDSPRTPGA